jgi:hypothetical protein
MISKDSTDLILINIEKGEAKPIMKVPFEGIYCAGDSLAQYLTPDGHLRVVTIAHK